MVVTNGPERSHWYAAWGDSVGPSTAIVYTLARNARTSPEIIDRFYAARLRGKDGIEMLQSRRKGKSKTKGRQEDD